MFIRRRDIWHTLHTLKGEYMSVWDDFYKLSVLKVNFLQNSAAKNATIYGNGNNQVAVVLHATVLGEDLQPLSIPLNELLEATHLINYVTGEKLNWKGNIHDNSPWEYSDVDKGFSNPVNYSSAVPDPQENREEGAFTIVYYVSSSQLSSGLDVGAGINIPGVGEFNTTAEGTSTTNNPGGTGGSVFKSPSFVHVQALNKIDYSLKDSVKMDGGPTSFSSFRTVVNDILVNGMGHKGTSGKTTATISPAQSSLKFKQMSVLSPSVTSGFKLAGGGGDTVWGVGGANYDTIFIFVNRRAYGLLPDNKITTATGAAGMYYYTIGPRDDRHHWTEELPEGVITIRICNHRIPRSGLHQNGWGDSGKNIRVQVADDYGNTGTVSIKVHDDSWPELHVNS